MPDRLDRMISNVQVVWYAPYRWRDIDYPHLRGSRMNSMPPRGNDGRDWWSHLPSRRYELFVPDEEG